MVSQLSRTLQGLIHDRLTNARQIAAACGVSPSTVYRWVNGESQPSFHAVGQMVRQLPNTDAQKRLIQSLQGDSPWQVVASETTSHTTQTHISQTQTPPPPRKPSHHRHANNPISVERPRPCNPC